MLLRHGQSEGAVAAGGGVERRDVGFRIWARKEDLKEFREYSVRKIWNETGTVGC